MHIKKKSSKTKLFFKSYVIESVYIKNKLKIMKKTMLLLLGAGLFIATPSCKKGENDPLLSLKSRKARLAGEYKVSKIERVSKSIDNSGQVVSQTDYTYDGGSTATTITTTTSGNTTTSTEQISLYETTFKKDGTWEMKKNYTTVSVFEIPNLTKTTTTTDRVETTTGVWAFVGKTKDKYKNKERLQLSTLNFENDYTTTDVTEDLLFGGTTTTSNSGKNAYTFSALEYTMTYAIDMLKSKEIVLKNIVNSSYTNTNSSGTTTSKFTVDETMTLTQK